MLQSLAIIVFCIVPQPTVVVSEAVLEIEVNHRYEQDGRLSFVQVLYREEDSIVDQRLLSSQSLVPARDWTNGGYVATWLDYDVMRQVRCKNLTQTWTQYEPRIQEGANFQKGRRKALKGSWHE